MYKKFSPESLGSIFLVSVISIALLVFGRESVQLSKHGIPARPSDATPLATSLPAIPEQSTENLEASQVQSTGTEVSVGDLVLVTRVIDGDTIELATGEKVRYIGIDTPELHARDGSGVQCFAGEAAERNVQLVFQKKVHLVKDKGNTDSYGRLLRYVYVGDVFVNETLVREGYAYAKRYPPNTALQSMLGNAEQDARHARRGMWSTCQ